MVVVMLPLLVARLCRSNFIVILILILRSFYRSHCSKKSKLSSKRERKIRRSPNRLTTNKKRKIQSSGLGLQGNRRKKRKEGDGGQEQWTTRLDGNSKHRLGIDRTYIAVRHFPERTTVDASACWCVGGWYYASHPHRDGSHEYYHHRRVVVDGPLRARRRRARVRRCGRRRRQRGRR